MYLMPSQKVVVEQCGFGMLGHRLEGEQALSTSSPGILLIFLASVPTEASMWVRGWGSADVLCWPGLGGWCFTHSMSLGTAGLGGDVGTGISGMVCAQREIGRLLAEQLLCPLRAQGLQEAACESRIFRQVTAREVPHLHYFSSLPQLFK